MEVVEAKRELIFYVNGRKVVDAHVDPSTTLLSYLRTKLGLCGTKLGCGEGGCGACTVMVSHYDAEKETPVHRPVNACLAPVCSVADMAVTTVEGIGSVKTRLHPVQERIARSHGSQCGFCTPGIVMSMYTLLRNTPAPTLQQIEDAFDGNLCRCTGYRAILEGFKTFAVDQDAQGCCAGQCASSDCCTSAPSNTASTADGAGVATAAGCCGGGGKGGCPCRAGPPSAAGEDEESIKSALADPSSFTPLDPSQEPIFPPALVLAAASPPHMLHFRSSHVEWFRPVTMTQLLALKQAHPEARLIVGNTEVGVETKYKGLHPPVMVAVTHVAELRVLEENEDGLVVGGSVTLSELQDFCTARLAALPAEKQKGHTFAAVLENLRWFAGPQIRSVASLAGNIATASPISDLNPIWVAAGAQLTVCSQQGGTRRIAMADFFLDYRRTALQPTEVIVSLHVPHPRPLEFVEAYKQARRREDDIAVVNACMRVRLAPVPSDPDTFHVEEIHLAYGGVSKTVVQAKRTEQALAGRVWDQSLLDSALATLPEDVQMSTDAPGGMVEYRRTLATTFFFKFYLTVLSHLQPAAVPPEQRSAIERVHRPVSRATHLFEAPLVGTPADTIGQPVPHLAAEKQATGEAVYTDDIPKFTNELYAALVLSKHAHAEIRSIDPAAALALPGVHGFFSAKDVPAHNDIGPVVHDEEVFASHKVVCVGQVVGMVVAETQAQAQQAARLVKVDYHVLPAILTIEEAIAAQSFFVRDRTLGRGNVEEGFAESDVVVEGELRMGGQEHFYMETQACICVPSSEGEMEVLSSTQAVSKTQTMVAAVLGLPANRVTCRVKRMGGGFGGKETRSIYLACALAVGAYRLNRPVRCMLDRHEDMASSGGRHPFLARYRVGATRDGRLRALDVTMYSNAGCSLDLSGAVLDRALFHLDNAYHIPHVRGVGFCCKTNLPTNTAFRGFGGPQGMFFAESWMSELAHVLGLPQDHVRELNFYREAQPTHFGQILEANQMAAVWSTLKESSNYAARLQEVAAFNAAHRWRKRGLALVPTKFGIAFTATFMNQAGALVHVYTDGSVLLAHGGTEMGQGLHTKMAQVCARALGVKLEQVHVAETSTSTVANTSPTAASASSDLNGMAVLHACQQISDRLAPYRQRMPGAGLAQLAQAAYMDRVDLSAHGFYRTPDLDFDWAVGQGRPFNYFCYGAACVEAEVDVLTGDSALRRADMVMDVGASLNPAVDIGQVEGAFVQGCGLFLLEEMWFGPQGQLRTFGPGTYKLPGFKDIPVEMHVALLRNAPNARAVHSSKAVGEPPLFLGAAAYFAVKEAVIAAREESGLPASTPFRLDSPATVERVRMACEDAFTKRFPVEKGPRWNVIV